MSLLDSREQHCIKKKKKKKARYWSCSSWKSSVDYGNTTITLGDNAKNNNQKTCEAPCMHRNHVKHSESAWQRRIALYKKDQWY